MSLPLAMLRLDDGDQVEALEARGSYTTMTRDGARAWPAVQAALLVDQDGEALQELGTVTRSPQRVATGWHRLRYVRRAQFEPVPLDTLYDMLPSALGHALDRRATWGGTLTTKTADATIGALNQLRPEIGHRLRELIGAGTPDPTRLWGDALQSAAHEADAVRLAADIAGIPRRDLGDLRPDGHTSFVGRLAEVRVAEDPAVAYDSMRFLDFHRIDSPSGIVQFRNKNEQLTVINVNRQPLEHTTGADLIYINEITESFVLVQYKAMRREGQAPSRLVYRPDRRLESELERMRSIQRGRSDGTPQGFRLHPGCCFLKLCKPVARLDRTRDLVSGMYLPLELYDTLSQSNQVRGPRGGVALSYESVGRYVSNDLFVSLVRGGWVGSRGATSARLTKITLDALNADRSVTVAAATRQGSPD